ncbi:RICIN domain-containing protein, partial [Micromonospora sp. NPDC051296]|uniref:RICIN domain-containing protein n=1 Tax=Micromonospora sp. NPDC051296 TaxID=3155046 RepID=UPI00343B02D6
MVAIGEVSSAAPRRRGWLSRVAAAVVAVVVGGTLVAVTPSPATAATVDTNAWYVLVNRNSGKALDVYNLATNDGARITQWARNDGAWQQWQFVDSGGGYYRLKSRHSGKVLDVYNWSTANGAAIVQWADGNGANQQFRLADSAGGYVRLINRNSNKVVEVQNASTADGGNVVQYDDFNGTHQQWQLIQVGGGGNPGTPGGNFTNPVVWQDVADVDIIRVGDVYYLSASTMHYSPGAPVLRSYDLVNWEFAGHSVPRLDFGTKYDLPSGQQAYVDGIWASTLNYRPSNRTFYWAGCIDFSQTHIYTAA